MSKKQLQLKKEVNRMNKDGIAELQHICATWLNLDTLGKTTRTRVYTWPRVFWLFLSQTLSADGSCREAVQKLLAWLAFEANKTASPNTAAYCKARAKLSTEKLKQVYLEMVQTIQSAYQTQGLWYGRHVKVVDGSGLSMPDTPQNQEKIPQSQKVVPGCGFPEMRIAALFSLATGILLHYRCGSRYVSERTLFQQLWENLIPGDVILADRGFCGYLEFQVLRERGVDSVMRLHQRRSVGVQIIKKLGPGDALVEWVKMKPCPRGVTKEQWVEIPDVLKVRHISFTIDIPGFRSKNFTIATTLTDHKQFPAKSIAELYRKRWYVELYFRDIKISMNMDILRCLTPKMIEKEVIMHIIAYNLIRVIMIEAANKTQQMLERISFKGTCQALREWTPVFAVVQEERATTLYEIMLKAIGNIPLPHRPDRSEPRARKRRPKSYQLLNKPREVFKEIPHRNKYVKPA